MCCIGLGRVLASMDSLSVHVSLHLSKDPISSVFLPPLVFEAACDIRWSEFKADLPVVSLPATAGVVLAAAVTAVSMHYAVHRCISIAEDESLNLRPKLAIGVRSPMSRAP